MSLNDRVSLLRKFKLCYNCLKGNHFSSTCRKPKACSVSGCNVKHHTLLHKWVVSNGSQLSVEQSVEHENQLCVDRSLVHCASTENEIKNCLGIIPITVVGKEGRSLQTYALIDDGADKTLCDERLLSALDIPSKPVTHKMSTITSRHSTNVSKEVNLDVKPMGGDHVIPLQRVWSIKSICTLNREESRFESFPLLVRSQHPTD